jgi:hypothetical protein
MLDNHAVGEKIDSNAGHVNHWSQIAANTWHPDQVKADQPKAQLRDTVVKPILIDGQIIHFPVTICPPGSASGLEKPKPKLIVEGGACSPR